MKIKRKTKNLYFHIGPIGEQIGFQAMVFKTTTLYNSVGIFGIYLIFSTQLTFSHESYHFYKSL